MSEFITVKWKNSHGGTFIHAVRSHWGDQTICGKDIPVTATRGHPLILKPTCVECERKNRNSWQIASFNRSHRKPEISKIDLDIEIRRYLDEGGLIDEISPSVTPLRNDKIYTRQAAALEFVDDVFGGVDQ